MTWRIMSCLSRMFDVVDMFAEESNTESDFSDSSLDIIDKTPCNRRECYEACDTSNNVQKCTCGAEWCSLTCRRADVNSHDCDAATPIDVMD